MAFDFDIENKDLTMTQVDRCPDLLRARFGHSSLF